MLKIRLARIGKRKQPYYRITVAENSRDTFGKFLEILGSYDPRSKVLDAKDQRIKYWIEKGAQMTPTVNNLLLEKKVIEGKKVQAAKKREKKSKKK